MKNIISFPVIVAFCFLLFIISCDYLESNGFSFIKDKNGNVDAVMKGQDTSNSDRVYFYETGEIWGYEKFRNSQKHGHSYFFYKSGNLKSHWIYYEGHPDGYCYNYGDTYDGYPMEFLVYGGIGQLVLREKYDSTGKLISSEGQIPKDWEK